MRTGAGWIVAALLLATVACTPRSGAYPVDTGWEADAGNMDADAVGEAREDVPAADPGPDVRVPVPARGSCRPNGAAFPTRPEVGEAPTVRPVHVFGRDLVDDQGNRVALRGVNLGAWLQAETWISGLGQVYEWELFRQMPEMADVYGVRDLYDAAFESVVAEWTLELRSKGPLIDGMRAGMVEAATPDRKGAVDAYWAWFDGVPFVFDEQSLWEWVGEREGWNRAMEMREAFADTWITETDLQLVAAMGLNLVRVPVWYDALETDLADGANGFRPEGWRHLDDVARWARRHGLYVMIDLHGLPGGQGTAFHQGLRDGGHLWERAECRDKAARLWKAIASYFDGDPHVAVLDLANEPMSVPSAEAYRDVHDAMYRAIRQADPDASFIVMAEDGFKPGSMLATPKEMGWVNAMFSIHMYPSGLGDAAAYVAAIEDGLRRAGQGLGSPEAGDWSTRFDCPLFVGEFSAHEGGGTWAVDAMDGALQALNARGVHWAPWTWKHRQKDSPWGVLHPPVEDDQRIDLERPFEDVMADLPKLSSSGWVESRAYAGVLRARARDAVLPLALPAQAAE